jgi:hypothetical protein
VTLTGKGPEIKVKEAFKYYSNVNSGVKVMITVCLGGTTVVSAGNGMRCLPYSLFGNGTK